MRISKVLLTIILFVTTYGCSKEQSYETEKKYVSVLAGEISYVNVKTDLTQSNYKLISEDKDIATATFDVQPDFLCISTHKSGSTNIRVIKVEDNQTVCEIYVYARYFNSREIIDYGIPLEEHSGVVIKSTDITIQKEIENDIREKGKSLTGTLYTFNQNTRRFTMDIDSDTFYEGSYEWNIDTLSLMYNNKIENYGFKVASGMRNGYIIQCDKTKYYQQQYPNAGITEIKINRVWKDNGIIQL